MGLIDDITRRKPVESLQREADTGTGLRRVLGLWQLTAIGLGGIIGVGIFVLTGTVAATQAGPAVLLSFLLAGIASAAAALCYAEFAGLIPVSGSAYTYGYAVLGEFAGWIIGWDLLLEYALIAAVVAVGWSGYAQVLLDNFGLPLPTWAQGAWGTAPGRVVNLPAILISVLITALLAVRMLPTIRSLMRRAGVMVWRPRVSARRYGESGVAKSWEAPGGAFAPPGQYLLSDWHPISRSPDAPTSSALPRRD